MVRYETASAIEDDNRAELYRWLRAHNRSTNGPYVSAIETGACKSLMVLSRDNDGTLVGGLLAETVFGWLRIQIMAVAPAKRRTGIGSRLLALAEHEARRRRCRTAYVDTMTYQGPEFYLKAGYAEVGRLRDWDSHGNDKVFLTKHLL